MNWKILLLLVKEANLGQKYSKTVASAKTKFNNEESNFYNISIWRVRIGMLEKMLLKLGQICMKG